MARYRLTASRPPRSHRAVLIDAVEVGSIGLGKFRDAPERGELPHVLVYHVAFIDEQVAQAQGLHFARSGSPYARRGVARDDFGRVGDGHPAPPLGKHLHLQVSVPRRVALQHNLVDQLPRGELHLKAGMRCNVLPGGPAGGITIVEGELRFSTVGPGAERQPGERANSLPWERKRISATVQKSAPLAVFTTRTPRVVTGRNLKCSAVAGLWACGAHRMSFARLPKVDS